MNMTSCSSCAGKPHLPSRIPQDYRDKCHVSSPDTCTPCQKLKALDEKIRDARDTLDRLLDEREAMTGVLNQHHDPLTRRLPVELVSRVFAHSIPLLGYKFGTLPDAIRLTQVCQRWREIAHNSPSLWTNIHVAAGGALLGKDTILESCLNRSGDLPLSIEITVPEDGVNNPIPYESFLASVALLCRHARRWMFFGYDGGFSVLNMIATSVTRFDQLKSMRMYLPLGESPSNDITFVATPHSLSTNDSPQEMRLHIDYCKLKVMGESYPFDISISHCIELFQEAPQLEVCDFDSIFENENTVLPQTPMVAHSLRELTLSRFDNIFWDLSEFPSLTKLQVGSPETEAGWVTLKHCLVRSNCRIEDFSLVEALPSIPGVIELLSMMPYLRKLYLGKCTTTDVLFSTLYKSAGSSEQFLSKLTAFGCASYSHISWPSPILFLDLMTTRQERTLRSVSFTCYESDAIKKSKTVVDKTTLKYILAVAARLEFTMTDSGPNDMLLVLCQHHGMDIPAYAVS